MNNVFGVLGSNIYVPHGPKKYVDLAWLVFSIKQLYLSGICQGLCLKTYTCYYKIGYI